jgi:hypothetical protein
MSEEEISAALETVEANNGAEYSRLKAALSKANSQAADYKKQLRSKLTEDEAAAAARQEEYDNLIEENNKLKRSIELSNKTTRLVGMGYDTELAAATAAAMVDGDMDTVMNNQLKYIETQKKSILAEKLKSTPRPTHGSENAVNDYQKKIAEAQANGNYSAAAYYTRLSSQLEIDQTE